jgi:hypothetical protein
MLTIIVSGRNDDYGQNFRERLFRTALHNAALLSTAGIEFEYFLAEWNPLPYRPSLSSEFVSIVPNARAVIIPAAIHRAYTLNPEMPFHEMPAKNAALRRAKGDVVIVTNADIMFSEVLVDRIARGGWSDRCLYRAHRIDVKPELDWDEIQDPANQLPSGEGRCCPPYYLGAGGDFCLAKRSLWHSLRGFNERIRFSTRAKDWQFFLSAAAEGVDIEFIGDVYHLDHEDGFRNTDPKSRNANRVHFGRWWDIEFGLPVTNSIDWGFSDVRQRGVDREGRITTLCGRSYYVTDEQNARDREMMRCLTHPAGVPDTASAFLLHAICAAHRLARRLICRITEPRLLAILSGFDVVASRFSIDIRCNSRLPAAPGHTRRSFSREPAAFSASDLLLEEAGANLQLSECETGRELPVLPTAVKVDEPDFNPILGRRLLRAYLQLQRDGHKTVAIYGGGGHTNELLRWGMPDSIRLVQCFKELRDTVAADAVLLSSASYESDMLAQCRQAGTPNVIALYADWPAEMWEAGVTA